jgi:hypothetical protein
VLLWLGLPPDDDMQIFMHWPKTVAARSRCCLVDKIFTLNLLTAIKLRVLGCLSKIFRSKYYTESQNRVL